MTDRTHDAIREGTKGMHNRQAGETMPTGKRREGMTPSGDAEQARGRQDAGDAAYDQGDKDALARVWDTVLGSRHAGTSERQDRAHSTIVFLVLLALVTSIASLSVWLWHDHASYREDHILVPAATYASDQVTSVETQLQDMGFVDIAEGDTGVTAYGTKAMCDAWRSSFWDRNVSDAVTDLGTTSSVASAASHMANGIIGMSHSDDWTTVTIKTLTSDPSVSVIGYMLESDTTASDAIDAAANWCAVLHDGQRLHVSFVGQDGNEYLAIDTDTAHDIIAKLQGQEAGDSEGNVADGSDKDATAEGGDTGDDHAADATGNAGTNGQ